LPFDEKIPDDECYQEEFGHALNPEARFYVTDATVPIVVTMLPFESGWATELWIDAPERRALLHYREASPPDSVTLGPYPVGTELLFGLEVYHSVGYHWQTGPRARNADGKPHAAITFEAACTWTLGFE